MPLIVVGGLGFPVTHDLYHWLRWRLGQATGGVDNPAPALLVGGSKRGRRYRFSLHSRIVLWSTAGLIVVPALALLLFESVPEWRTRGQIETATFRAEAEGHVATMIDLPPPGRAAAALFQSVTARTAGFNTVHTDVDSMSPASHVLTCLLMFIGGSPASTAGGAKTVGIALLVLGVYSTLRGRSRVECGGRTIPDVVMRRAAAVTVLMFALAAGVTLALCYTESAPVQRILFESVSACGTVGLSTGLTDELTVPGRLVIILAMFVGRLGPLTVLIALAGRPSSADYEYPEEQPIIG
jgi:trk system potassium uptake protein TrkH